MFELLIGGFLLYFLFVFGVWIGIAVLTGIYASHRGRSGFGWFFLSLFIPILAFIIVALAGPPSGVLVDSKGRITAPKNALNVQRKSGLKPWSVAFVDMSFRLLLLLSQ
jgi:hypothetical protein